MNTRLGAASLIFSLCALSADSSQDPQVQINNDIHPSCAAVPPTAEIQTRVLEQFTKFVKEEQKQFYQGKIVDIQNSTAEETKLKEHEVASRWRVCNLYGGEVHQNHLGQNCAPETEAHPEIHVIRQKYGFTIDMMNDWNGKPIAYFRANEIVASNLAANTLISEIQSSQTVTVPTTSMCLPYAQAILSQRTRIADAIKQLEKSVCASKQKEPCKALDQVDRTLAAAQADQLQSACYFQAAVDQHFNGPVSDIVKCRYQELKGDAFSKLSEEITMAKIVNRLNGKIGWIRGKCKRKAQKSAWIKKPHGMYFDWNIFRKTAAKCGAQKVEGHAPPALRTVLVEIYDQVLGPQARNLKESSL